MKNFIIVLFVIFIIYCVLGSVRCCVPNSRDPVVTRCGNIKGSPNYDLHDENVECFGSHDCFWLTKRGTTISRDDVCDRCNMKWKLHYNKD